jgi:hypothetical protein
MLDEYVQISVNIRRIHQSVMSNFTIFFIGRLKHEVGCE